MNLVSPPYDMTSKIDALKFYPQRFALMRLSTGWRFLLSVAVMAAYMIASRVIYHTDGLSFAELELLRTPFRLVAALLFWFLMGDVIFAARPNLGPLRRPIFIVGCSIAFMVPLLALAGGGTRTDAVTIAIASFPVALNEEFFFRGVLQAMLVRYIGALQGIALTVILFALFHVGVGPRDVLGFTLVALAGLILGLVYFKTGSMAASVAIHATYDALTSVLDEPLLSRAWGSIFLLCASGLLLHWARTQNRFGAGHQPLGGPSP